MTHQDRARAEAARPGAALTRRDLLRLLGAAGCLAAATGVLAACGGTAATATSPPASTAAATVPPATTAPTAAASASSPTTAASPTAAAAASPFAGPHTAVTLATGFMPNVQFAPYYLAADRGYYSEAGIDITIKDGANAGLLEQLGSGALDFGLTGGDALTPARAKGIPVTYIMAQFQKYPVGALAITGTNPPLTAPADLKGRNVGVSAPNGSTYIGLLALLQAAKLTLNDIHLISIGFTEVEALQQKRVDAAMTFLTNEPVQVRALGLQIQTLAVADYAKLVSTGLATGEKNLTGRADLVQRFVAASLRGLRATQQEPDAAFAAALKRMPEVAADAKQTQIQRDVLTSTLAFEQPPVGHPLGWSDPDAWQAMQDLLKSSGLIDKTVDPALLYTNRFAEAAG